MASSNTVTDDLESFMAIFDENILDSDASMQEIVSAAFNSIPDVKETHGFSCDLCTKICLSKRGLTRHKNSKHSTSSNHLLSLTDFSGMVHKSFVSLSSDECYPEVLLKEFKDMCEEARHSLAENIFHVIVPIVAAFKGDAEKFYPKFYKLFSDEDQLCNKTGLTKHATMLLGMELANHVLAHLSGFKVSSDFTILESHDVSEKEKTVISYIGGYVVSTIYKRIRFHKDRSKLYHQQCLAFLLSCKVDNDSEILKTSSLVDIKNRGGLWKIKENVLMFFVIAETRFKSVTAEFVRKIDSKEIVHDLLRNCKIISIFHDVCSSLSTEVNKEILLNLLEDLLTLYIRVRSHSYAKDQQQKHAIETSKNRSRSLRTSMKEQEAASTK